MDALLDRVEGLDVYGGQAAVIALLAGSEALEVVAAERWATDDPALAAWATEAAALVRSQGPAQGGPGGLDSDSGSRMPRP
jgi:hypothetical protein